MNYRNYSFQHLPDLDTAKLRLALVKENFDFRRFFEKLRDDPYATCPELRKPNEIYEDYSTRVHLMEIKHYPFFAGQARNFGVNERFLLWTQQGDPVVSLSEILDLLNPKKDLTHFAHTGLLNLLPAMFYFRGVSKISHRKGIVAFGQTPTEGETQLRPYELILEVDLRKRKAQLLDEFKEIIEKELEIWKAGKGLKLGSYVNWSPTNSRERKEAMDQLEVWLLRKQKRSFQWIARTKGITEDLAKKRFYRAYELTQRKPYNPERFKKTSRSPRIYDLDKTCETYLEGGVNG
jgi:hypothetical protein